MLKYAVSRLSRDYMKMQVLNDLPRRSTAIAQDIIPICLHRPLDSPANWASRAIKFKRLRRAILQPAAMMLWNQQRMAVPDGSYVQKRQHMVIFIDLKTADLASGDFTKYSRS